MALSDADYMYWWAMLQEQQNSSDSKAGGDSKDSAAAAAALDKLMYRAMLQNWTNINAPEYDLLRSPIWRGIVLTLYIVVILMGIMGNSAVIFIVARSKKLRNVTNLLIANLALSDISLCVFSLPIQLYYQMTDHWVFGENLCRIIFAAFAVPMYLSVITILLIAFDRYWLIVYPLKSRLTIKMTFALITIMAILSLALAMPVVHFTSLHKIDDPDLHINRHYCIEMWPDNTGRKIYSALMFTFQFCTPLFITSVLYLRIYWRLRERHLANPTNVQRKQKTNRILMAIVLLFIVCWLPWNIFSILTEMSVFIVKGPHFKFIDLILKVFALSSACVNPFLYCWLNDNFRKELDTMAIKLKIYRESSSFAKADRTSCQHQPMVQAENGFIHSHTERLDPTNTCNINSSLEPPTYLTSSNHLIVTDKSVMANHLGV